MHVLAVHYHLSIPASTNSQLTYQVVTTFCLPNLKNYDRIWSSVNLSTWCRSSFGHLRHDVVIVTDVTSHYSINCRLTKKVKVNRGLRSGDLNMQRNQGWFVCNRNNAPRRDRLSVLWRSVTKCFRWTEESTQQTLFLQILAWSCVYILPSFLNSHPANVFNTVSS
jgi:hypothetical protein